MGRRTLIVALLMVVLIVMAVGAAPSASALGGPKGKVTGVLTGVIPGFLDQYGNVADWEFQVQFSITQVGPNAVNGWEHWKGRAINPNGPWVELYVAIDCVSFLTVDGYPAAIYSGRITKSTMYDWWFCDWQGQQKVGMVIDGGNGGAGDGMRYWQPMTGCFFPAGQPLVCTVPPDSVEQRFILTGGDIVVRPN